MPVPNRRPEFEIMFGFSLDTNMEIMVVYYRVFEDSVVFIQHKGFLLMCPTPDQKLAQKDAAALQDMFSLSCFFSWLVPKMEGQLGRDSDVLMKILEMWELGYLGWEQMNKNRSIPACAMLRCQSYVDLKFRTTF